MPDLCFYRDPEQTEKEEQETAEKAVTKEELQGECPTPAPEFTAAQPEMVDWSEGLQQVNVRRIPRRHRGNPFDACSPGGRKLHRGRESSCVGMLRGQLQRDGPLSGTRAQVSCCRSAACFQPTASPAFSEMMEDCDFHFTNEETSTISGFHKQSQKMIGCQATHEDKSKTKI
ncbi:hypothetical protein M91_00751 [Bos mutus]|uniref:Small ribosomal subunit protein uS2 C-terminal domain-containing protein n=1 Tax=Bos mutus TaxID=72004 RepID=L8J0E8_9CETA|nr:hypothetical protein M91_00751 [Bos mutus]